MYYRILIVNYYSIRFLGNVLILSDDWFFIYKFIIEILEYWIKFFKVM